MGVWAQFEEKEYETLANAALIIEQARRSRGVRMFSPGQALEKILGYDFATRIDPRSRLYRRLFGAAPGAVGVSAAAQAANSIPVSPTTRLLNVFIQYKRPQYFRAGHRSPVWPTATRHLAFQVREQHPDPAHQFDQIRALRKLQVDLGRDANVRYACPNTWLKQDLYDHFYRGSLLRSSVFVRPDQLLRAGIPEFHARWTFEPTNSRRGIPNPDGAEAESLDGEEFLEEVERETTQQQAHRSTEEVLIQAADQTQGLRDELEHLRPSRPRDVRESFAAEDRAIERELSGFTGRESDLVRATVDVAVVARDVRATWTVALDA
ncbi:hypothetical protein M3672_05475 [Microbacterium enclense]|uniref:hypothetical protein n=1 Tax=Microbacterium enclense TaxID=993073 RepID=UPI0020406F44|nr:hypothetical protein [Microbacterium enclense]MCM3613886.1 hypothetical protein [Microbacterium enclense]